MDWLALLKITLSAVVWLLKMAHDRELIDGAKYEVMAKTNEENLKHLAAVIAARSAPGVPESADPDNRDRVQ